jgi:hypothetical protein
MPARACVVSRPMNSLELLKMSGGSYVVSDGKRDPRWVESDSDLRGYLLSAGLSTARVDEVITALSDLQEPPRKIVVAV